MSGISDLVTFAQGLGKEEATQWLVEAGRILDIELVDHIIIGHRRFVSLKKHLGWE
jgi:DNA repair protein RadC